MTQEEKQLLLVDLCARLPYEIKIHIESNFTTPDDVAKLICVDTEKLIYSYSIGYLSVRTAMFNHLGELTFKPYLRPMSSMTKEEKQESRWYKHDAKSDDFILYMNRYVEWLDSNHFDWRTDGNGKTMIENGLALEAPEDMYKI